MVLIVSIKGPAPADWEMLFKNSQSFPVQRALPSSGNFIYILLTEFGIEGHGVFPRNAGSGV